MMISPFVLDQQISDVQLMVVVQSLMRPCVASTQRTHSAFAVQTDSVVSDAASLSVACLLTPWHHAPWTVWLTLLGCCLILLAGCPTFPASLQSIFVAIWKYECCIFFI